MTKDEAAVEYALWLHNQLVAAALRKRAAAALPENKNNRWVIELLRAADLIEKGELP